MQIGIQTVCALAMFGLSLGISTSVHAGALTVKTKQGNVRGKTINYGKVKAFLGLPYAAPPVGDLRWKPPLPPPSWKGERDATNLGARCAQNRIYDDMVFEDSGPSEDCLFLNVYAPANSTTKSKLAVMFWIHGGGNKAGASSEPRHNGDFLPLKGVVLVTINYRLGVFGFLATEDLAREANGAAGNYGLMDMVAALQWVKANIRQFGGDPNNVTIFGESAGSFAVSALMASQAARVLFQRAIGESGAAFPTVPPTDSLQAREKRDGEWVASLGVHSLQQLRALPADKILDAAKGNGADDFQPVVDGKLLTEPVADTYAKGKQAPVPLLAGWNRDENTSLAGDMTVEKWMKFAAAHFNDRAAEFLTLYSGNTDAQAVRSAIDYGSDTLPNLPMTGVALSTWKWLEAHRKISQPAIYRYHFELPAPPSKFNPGGLAFHSDDIEYVFGTLDTRPGAVWRPEDRRLSEQMMSYWTNFAKTGDPNGPGLPDWPKYASRDRDELIHLDSTITAGPDTLRPRYEFLLKVLPNQF